MNKNVQAASKPYFYQGGGVWKTSALPSGQYALLATISDENTLSTMDSGNTISWIKPVTYPNGDVIPALTITGYKVYKKGVEERYAVAVTFSGGQSALSDSVASTWRDLVAAPSGANTVTALDSQATIQAAYDALGDGGVLYLSDVDGDFSYTATGGYPSGVFLSMNNSGTAGNFRNVMAVPGEAPVIAGVGWADEAVGPAGSQALIDMVGDYNRFYGIEVKDSGEIGLNIHGSFNEAEENDVHSSWGDNIVIGDENLAGNDSNNNLIQYNKSHNSRLGQGILVKPKAGRDYNIDNNTVRRNLCYRNGFNDDDSMNPYLGGNSDGLAVGKDVHDDYLPGGPLDPAVTGRENRCRNFHVLENIYYLNGDDGQDVSSGNGTIIAGNIAFKNAPSGDKAYKVLRNIYEEQTYICNAALGSEAYIFPSDVIYYEGLVGTFSASDVITGSVSGATATVVSDTASTHLAGEGILEVTGLSGSWHSDDELQVSAVTVATILSIGTKQGLDHRVNDSEPTRSDGRINVIGTTAYNFNPPGGLAARGMSIDAAASRPPDAGNNLSFNNKSSDIINGAITQLTSIINTDAIVGDLEDPNFLDPSATLTGATIQEQWRNLYRAFWGQIMPTVGGNLIDAGTSAATFSDYYHSTAADDSAAPSDPDDNTKSIWTGTAPAIGAAQYQKIFPPVASIS